MTPKDTKPAPKPTPKHEHGTPESWLAGCRCQACAAAEPDANAQVIHVA